MRGSAAPPGADGEERSWAITNARIYPAPGAAPIDRCTVLVRGGRIAQVGASVSVPSRTQVLDGRGCAVTAGFWNVHVHLSEAKWSAAGGNPGALNRYLTDMLSARGFTTAVDLGSDPRITFGIQRGLRSGELRGPRLYAAGTGVYPRRGVPYYLKGSIPFLVRWLLPQPRTPVAAARAVRKAVRHGANVLKLFTGSYVKPGLVRPMSLPVARAAVEAAHASGLLVFAHTSDLEGTRVARDAGVDVLAHAPDRPEGIDDAFLRSLIERRMAMVPTLKMFETTVTAAPSYLLPIYRVVHRFRELGGELLFGTDVGYMTDYATEGELDALRRAGLDAPAILRMLTVAPAERFGRAAEMGTIAPGKLADLVVLEGDPAEDVRSFARVRFTLGQGRLLWSTV